MSINLTCNLCYTECAEYKSLQNEVGESNETYEITVKYFDPLLLTIEDTNKFRQETQVLCKNCWKSIKDFHDFQIQVIEIRTMLPTIIKDETEINLEHENLSYEVSKLQALEVKASSDNDENPLSLKYCNESSNLAQHEVSSTNTSTEELNKKPKSRNCKKISANSLINNTKKDEEGFIEDDKIGKYTENIKKAREFDAFIHEWKPILECDLCDETAPSYDSLRFHFKDKHDTRFYIKCCERKFYRRYVLVNHIQLHVKPDTYKCELCGKVSASKKNLALHTKLVHTKTEEFPCDICYKIFNLKSSLDRHLLTHATGNKNYVCKDCGKAYMFEVQLKTHMKTSHNIDRVCDQCGKTVHGIQALKRHLLEHAGVAKPKFPCDECEVVLITRTGLKRHKAAYHNDGSTIYVCGVCGKVAATKNALVTHKKYVHEKECKHKCTYCDKAFKRPRKLLEHIATHTGQPVYQCPHCSESFKDGCNMYNHCKKVHAAEWKKSRKSRLPVPKFDIDQVKNQVVL